MTSTAERDLVDEWIRAWTHVRGLTRTELDGWPHIAVRSLSRETELVCVEPRVDEFVALLRHVDGAPRAMLTIGAGDLAPYRGVSLPPGVRIDRDDETLMSTTLAAAPPLRLDSGFTARWDVDGHALTYTVDTGERTAARGTVGVLHAVATFDGVETTPRFQRRGLGRHVMTALTNEALDRGATRGVLTASADGRRLYESLGWVGSLRMLSLTGV